MHLLRQSTVATVLVGPVLDSTGAAVTTAVVGDFKIGKEGSTATLSGATVTHDGNGYYRIALTTGNTDTVGRLTIYSGNTSHSMGVRALMVLLPSVYDALVANATNTTGGLPTATGAISAFAGAISTFNRSSETVTVGTNNDKTGYKLASDGLSLVTSWVVDITGSITGNLSGSVGSVTGNVGGNVTGSVGSIAGVTFPTNFGLLGINGSGHVSRVVLVDTTTTNTDMRGTDGAALATHWTSTRAGYLDGVLIAANFSNRTVQVTGGGSGHIAADVHALQPAVINNTHFAAGAIDANAIAPDAIGASELAADAVTEIVAGMATQPQLVDLATMIVNDGTANARWSTSALQNAPTGGGGSATVNVLPYTGAVPDRVEGTTIKVFYNELTNVSVGVTDATGAAVTLDAKTLRFCVEDRYGVDVLTLNDGDITRSGSTFTVQIPQSLTDTVGANYRWSLRDLTGSLNTVLIHGQMIVAEAAEDEA